MKITIYIYYSPHHKTKAYKRPGSLKNKKVILCINHVYKCFIICLIMSFRFKLHKNHVIQFIVISYTKQMISYVH